MKILVIEDEPTSLKLANLVLSSGGHDVVEAYSAENALKAVHERIPDIILLDLALPGMDGLSLARTLKQDPATKAIPIIAVTAYPDRFSRDGVLGVGCDAYLVKPINTRTLSDQVIALAKAAPSEPASGGEPLPQR